MAASDVPDEPGALPGTVAERARAGLAGADQPPAPPPSEAALSDEPAAEVGSLSGDVRVLAEDARTMVEAELAYQSARAAYVWNRGKRVAVWLILALASGFFALIALVVGLLLALIPLLGVWLALAAVALGLIVIAAVALRLATHEIRRIRGQALAGDPVVAPKGVAPPEPMGPPTPAGLGS
ncbi:MAG: phage holin family protein [Novosphingobium sp.]